MQEIYFCIHYGGCEHIKLIIKLHFCKYNNGKTGVKNKTTVEKIKTEGTDKLKIYSILLKHLLFTYLQEVRQPQRVRQDGRGPTSRDFPVRRHRNGVSAVSGS